MESIEYPEGYNKERLEKEAKKEHGVKTYTVGTQLLPLENYDKKKIKYIKIKDLNSRFVLSKTKSEILNVKDEWEHDTEETIIKAEPEYDWKALEDSIKTHGIKKPLLVVEKTGYVEDGNHRLAVLKLLYSPSKKVPCVASTSEFAIQYEKELEYQKNNTPDYNTFQHPNVGKIIKIYK